MRPPKVHEKIRRSWSATWYKNAKLAQDEQRAHIIVGLLPVRFFRLSRMAFLHRVTDQLQKVNMEVTLLTWFSHKKLTKRFFDWSREFSYNNEKVVWTGWS